MLGITREENIGLLEYQARQARANFDEVNRPRLVEGTTFFGNGTGTFTQRQNTPEEAGRIASAAAAVREAELRLAQARLAEQEKGQAAILASVRTFSTSLQQTIEIQQKKEDQRRKANASAGAAQDQARLDGAEAQITDFIDSLKTRAETLPDTRTNLGAAPLGGVEGGLLGTIAGLGTGAEQAAAAIQNTLGSAVYAISDGIAGWATGMLSFGEAANQIWMNFKMAALQAFTDMVAQYAVKKAAMFAIDVLFSAKGLALQLASAAKSLIAWIPSAIAASISSFGTAALVGAAAVAAVIAATGGFADGGSVRGPGNGRSDSILARVSNGEYIMTADAVQRIGERNLDALNYGSRAPSSGGSASGGGGFGRGATILVDNRREADRFRRGSRMEAQIVQVAQAHRYRIAT